MESPVEAPSREPAERRAGRGMTAPYTAAASVVVFAVGSWFAWPQMEMWTSARGAERAFEAAASCLGLGPSVSDEILRRRAISAELHGEEWPARCVRTLTELEASADAAARELFSCEAACCPDDARCQAFTRMARASGELKRHLSGRIFAGGHARALSEIGTDLGWALPRTEPAESGEARSRRVTDMRPVSHHPLERAALCRTADAKWWLMAHHGEQGATLCELRRADATARCKPLSPAIPSRGDLFLIDGGLAPLPRLYSGDATGWSVHAPDGERLAEVPPESVGVTTLAGDGVAAISKVGEGYELIVDGVRRHVIEATSPPLLYAGYVISQRGHELVATSLADGVARTIGELASDARVNMRACVSAGVTAVRARDDASKSDVLASLRDGRWTLEELPAGVPPFTSSCHGAEVHLTWLETLTSEPSGRSSVRGTHRVHDVVCGRGGCRAAAADIALERYDLQSRFFVASLGEQVAVIWRSAQGDVRARIGPLSSLGQAPPSLVVEDAEHGGFAWDEAALRLLSAENAALLLLESGGTYAIVLDASGVRALEP